MVNDLCRGTCPAVEIKCLVIDEAHKALGNHAYCQVMAAVTSFLSHSYKNLPIKSLTGSPWSVTVIIAAGILFLMSLALCGRDLTVLCIVSALVLSKTWIKNWYGEVGFFLMSE